MAIIEQITGNNQRIDPVKVFVSRNYKIDDSCQYSLSYDPNLMLFYLRYRPLPGYKLRSDLYRRDILIAKVLDDNLIDFTDQSLKLPIKIKLGKLERSIIKFSRRSDLMLECDEFKPTLAVAELSNGRLLTGSSARKIYDRGLQIYQGYSVLWCWVPLSYTGIAKAKAKRQKIRENKQIKRNRKNLLDGVRLA